jgi:RNA polymerase sigma factor (TIGR02999 family)
MSPDSPKDDTPRTVTRLLKAWSGGNRQAMDELLPIVYKELQSVAGRLMRKEKAGHTLQTTGLVHEAYVRLVEADVPWQDRSHFFRVAARQMRRILVDHARARASAKRGGDAVRLPLNESLVVTTEPPLELTDLDAALNRLAEQDPRKAQVVELRLFGGLQFDEIAKVLELSDSTVRVEMRVAKAWLRSELERGVGER